GRQVCLDPKFGDQFDHQAVIFEYTNGTRVFGFTRDMPECFNNTSDFIIGTKGRCNLLSYRIEGETNWRFEGNRGNMYDQEHAELFAAIRGGTVINNGDYMCLSTLLGVVAQMACYTGDVIIWDEALKSKRVLTPPDLSFNSEPPVKPGNEGIYPAPKPGKAEYAKWLMAEG
ncbi:MAG: hypothetical protein Q7U75_11515, partial [Desulfobacterales bacterium]|nr:hypothetical protein [Desulfobacterales bacterium]